MANERYNAVNSLLISLDVYIDARIKLAEYRPIGCTDGAAPDIIRKRANDARVELREGLNNVIFREYE